MVGALLEAGAPPKQRHNVVIEQGRGLMSRVVWRGWTPPSWHLPSPNSRANSLAGQTATGPSHSQPCLPGPRSTTLHIAALCSWGSRQGSRSAAGSHGSWRECPARGSGQGCGGRTPAPRESSRVCGPSTTPAGQDRHGDIWCLVWAGPQTRLWQSHPRDANHHCFAPQLRKPRGHRQGLSQRLSPNPLLSALREGIAPSLPNSLKAFQSCAGNGVAQDGCV